MRRGQKSSINQSKNEEPVTKTHIFQRSDTELFAQRSKKKALEDDYRKKQSRNILIFLRLGSYKSNTTLT